MELQKDIADAHLKHGMQQQDIACKFRVTVKLVRDLVGEARHSPEKRQYLEDKVQKMKHKEEAIRTEARALMQQDHGIVNTKSICQAVHDNAGLEVSMKQVRVILKRDMQLSYVKSRKLYPNSN